MTHLIPTRSGAHTRTEPEPAGRQAAASLSFLRDRRQARTFLKYGYTPYPTHITRPFYLDDRQPEMATLYLQSASGGLYAEDDITLDISLARDTAVHLTPQAATVVHRCASGPARLATDIAIGPGAWLEMIGEPYILLPGARLETRTRVTLAPGAHGVLVESALAHTPAGMQHGPFFWDWHVRLATVEDDTLVLDRGHLDHVSIIPPGALSSLGTHGSLIALGPTFDDTRLALLRQRLPRADLTSAYWGASRLATASGLALRVLGQNAALVNDLLGRAWRLLRDPDYPPKPRRK